MTTVAQVIQNKLGQEIHTISPDSTVLQAITLMANKSIGAVVVTENNKVVGILSERDYTRKIALMQRTSDHTTVAEIMTFSPPFINTMLAVRCFCQSNFYHS